jgi:hypothetical protein
MNGKLETEESISERRENKVQRNVDRTSVDVGRRSWRPNTPDQLFLLSLVVRLHEIYGSR